MMPFIRCFNDYLLSGSCLSNELTLFRTSRFADEQAAGIEVGTKYRIGMYVSTTKTEADFNPVRHGRLARLGSCQRFVGFSRCRLVAGRSVTFAPYLDIPMRTRSRWSRTSRSESMKHAQTGALPFAPAPERVRSRRRRVPRPLPLDEAEACEVNVCFLREAHGRKEKRERPPRLRDKGGGESEVIEQRERKRKRASGPVCGSVRCST